MEAASGGVFVFRDLARCTARLKGARYEGAVIAAAEWTREGNGAELAAGVMPDILVDRHRMMRVRAADTSGTLVITMLLGRKAPGVRTAEDGVLHLAAEADGRAGGDVTMAFTQEDVRAFVHAIDDTNPLHEGVRPLVPGLLIMKKLLSLKSCKTLHMRFTVPIFVEQEVVVHIASLTEGGEPRSGGGCVGGRTCQSV